MKNTAYILGAIIVTLLIVSIPVIVYGTGAYIAIHFLRKFW